ncbi:PAS domain-containing protein [Terriglobus sp. 2YAB30_2]|uniref:PAS domain-containing protein n=1 Tax=Terriglobus sp. 2YAB30_2 TaxID=3233023 RepID=UPI003F94E9EA
MLPGRDVRPDELHADESARLKAVRSLLLFEISREFEEVLALAGEICEAPMGAIALVEEDCVICRSKIGIETSDLAGYQPIWMYVLEQGDLLVVNDTELDPHSRELARRVGNGVRFYAGIPFKAPNGEILGALCLMDTRPRELGAVQIRSLRALGRQLALQLRQLMDEAALDQATGEIQRRDRIFRCFLDALPIEAHLKDHQGRILFYNKKLAERFGISQTEWLGRSSVDLWPDTVARTIAQEDEQILRSGSMLDQCVETVDASGGPMYWRAIKVPLEGAADDRMVAGISVEIPDKVRTARHLDELRNEASAFASAAETSRRRFDAFMDSSPFLAFIKDAEGRMQYYNRTFAELFDISRSEWIGKTDHELWPRKAADSFREVDLRVLATGTPVEVEETTPGLGEGLEYWRTHKFPLAGSNGEIYLAGVAMNITLHREQEYHLARSLNEKEVLLREIHHRVKNNLAAISSLLYLQSLDANDPAARQALEQSRSRVRSMALVHESLYRSGDLNAVEFGTYTRELAENVHINHSAGAHIQLITHVEPVEISIDRAVPVGLIMNELLTNAFKHAFKGRTHGRVTVSVTVKPENFMRVSVVDDGVGAFHTLSPEDTPYLTENTGLNLVRSLVKQVNGEFQMSPLHPGTCAEIVVPLR